MNDNQRKKRRTRTRWSYERNSFDRFGDDLCEEILKHLWFANKIKFECVSRQWKRLIYSRQYILEIHEPIIFNLQSFSKSEQESDNTVNGLMAKRLLTFYDQNNSELKNVSVIERVLKKCPRINKITMDWKYYWFKLPNDQLWQIIADNCHNLTSIKINEQMSAKAMNYFGEKCGKTLQTITLRSCYPYHNYYDYQLLLHSCPNLLSINGLSLNHLINGIVFAKLREITDLRVSRTTLELMQSYVSSYGNKIKVFGVQWFGFVGNEFNKFADQIIKLTNIEKLEMKLNLSLNRDEDNDEDIGEDLRISRFIQNIGKIGINCVHIKHLSLEFFAMHASLNAAKWFTTINYLRISSLYSNIIGDSNLSINTLSQCKQIKSIVIHGSIDDQFFSGVDQCVPQLAVIEVITDKCISDQTINDLSNLENIRELNIECQTFLKNFCKNISITDASICNLIENCQQFRSLTLNPIPNITAITIDKFNEIARNKPKINFNHTFHFRDNEDETKLLRINYVKSLFSEKLAPNLNVKFGNLVEPDFSTSDYQ